MCPAIFASSEPRRADMTIATKSGGLIVKDGRLAQNCGCCVPSCTCYPNADQSGGCSPTSPAPCSLTVRLTFSATGSGIQYRSSNVYNCRSGDGGAGQCGDIVATVSGCLDCFQATCSDFLSEASATYELQKVANPIVIGGFGTYQLCQYAFRNSGAAVNAIDILSSPGCGAGSGEWKLIISLKSSSRQSFRVNINAGESSNCSSRGYLSPVTAYRPDTYVLYSCRITLPCTARSIDQSGTDPSKTYALLDTESVWECCGRSVLVEFI